MSIIQLQLNERLGGMIKEVQEQYNYSAEEIIQNSLDHFIKNKNDFLVGHIFELRQLAEKQKQEYQLTMEKIKQCESEMSSVVTVTEDKPEVITTISQDKEVDWYQFRNHRYEDLIILGIAMEGQAVMSVPKKRFQNSFFIDQGKQAMDMCKNDNTTIWEICKAQKITSVRKGTYTPETRPCSVANMLQSRLLKYIWHYGTPEEKALAFITNNKKAN